MTRHPCSRVLSARLLGFAVLVSATGLGGCGSEEEGLPIPIPDEFEAYFVAGVVCMPTNIATGTTGPGTAPTYPIRFDICRHRCITLDRATSHVMTSWQCAAGQCNMMMMASAHAYRVQSETGCDGRELPSPPSGECTPETYSFHPEPPCCMGESEYVTGDMRVSVPFMDLEQAEEVSERMAAGESPHVVVPQIVGQPPPDRIWTVNLDPAHPVVQDADSLSGSDCHSISDPR